MFKSLRDNNSTTIARAVDKRRVMSSGCLTPGQPLHTGLTPGQTMTSGQIERVVVCFREIWHLLRHDLLPLPVENGALF